MFSLMAGVFIIFCTQRAPMNWICLVVPLNRYQ